MSVFETIIRYINRLSVSNLPIRVSYYDDHCLIYELSANTKITRIDYKTIKRAYTNINNSPICNLCSEEAKTQMGCFDCGNMYCLKCFAKMICVNYSTGGYPCPYCKYVHKFSNNDPLVLTLFKTLVYFNIETDEIAKIIHDTMEDLPKLFPA